MMKDEEIVSLVEYGIEQLYAQDSWLLENDLSEQCISHRLAGYLQALFSYYHVDCEYNGSMFGDWREKKKVVTVKQLLLDNGIGLRKKEDDALNEDVIERFARPDIIVHQRGDNTQNLCIIEIKKSTNGDDFAYDRIKLSSYTSTMMENALCYQLGLFIEFETGGNERRHRMQFFKDGTEFTPKEQ